LGVSLASVPPGMSELSLRKVQPKVKVKKKNQLRVVFLLIENYNDHMSKCYDSDKRTWYG